MRISSVIAAVFLPVCFVSPLCGQTTVRNNTGFPGGARGIPQVTGNIGDVLADLAGVGGRQSAFHRGWLILFPTEGGTGQAGNNGGAGPTTVWDISSSNVANWNVVNSRQIGANGHKYYQIGDMFFREFKNPELQGLTLNPATIHLDFADVPARPPFQQDNKPFPLTEKAYDFPYKFDATGVLDIRKQNLGQRLSTVAWTTAGATSGKARILGSVGNLVFVGADDGGNIALWDISDPARPRLTDVLPMGTFNYAGGDFMIYRHYLIRGGANNVIDGQNQIFVGIDFSDPHNLRLAFKYPQTVFDGRYMEFQDTSAFTLGYKLDMEKVVTNNTNPVLLRFPQGGSFNFNWLPVGHLVVASTSNTNNASTRVYIHQTGLDTKPPTVGYHTPVAGATQVPVTAKIGLVIHETLDATTVVPANIRLYPTGNPSQAVETVVIANDYDVIRVAPVANLQPSTSYTLEIVPGTVKDAAGNAMAGFSFAFTTAPTSRNLPPVATAITPPAALTAGTSASFSATASDPENDSLQYRWDFGDASPTMARPWTGWATGSARSHTYVNPGNYTVVVQVKDANQITARAITVSVTGNTVSETRPTRSNTMALGPSGTLWTINPDNDSAQRLRQSNQTLIGSNIAVGRDPRGVAVDDANQAWIPLHDDDEVVVLNATNGTLIQRIPLGYGARPIAVVSSPDGTKIFVAGHGSGLIYEFNPQTRALSRTLDLSESPGASGITGMYANGENFDQPVLTQTDSAPAFFWSTNAPATGVNADRFSVRWIGSLRPSTSGSHAFSSTLQNGTARVFIDGREVTGGNAITLKAGQDYEVLIEYRHTTGSAKYQLNWKTPGAGSFTLVPSARLLPHIVRDARPAGLAINVDGTRLYVSQFLSEGTAGRVWEVAISNLTVRRSTLLAADAITVDGTANSRGLPNMPTALALSPQNNRAWVGAIKQNIFRGQFRDGSGLNFENTQRAILGNLLLGSEPMENFRVDLNDAAFPSAVAYSNNGNHIFVALRDNNRLLALDASTGAGVASINVGLAPDGIFVDPASNRIWVSNFMSRSVTVVDATGVIQQNSATGLTLAGTVSTLTTTEKLTNQVLRGKQLFYTSRDINGSGNLAVDDSNGFQSKLSRDGYMSCVSCHFDGGHDGRTWDFTDRGEGLRNTIPLLGRAGTGHGRVHWTANFDEIQDFENDIRQSFGGKGFLTTQQWNATSNPLGSPKAGLNSDLDALTAYVKSLTASTYPRSPYRKADGSLTDGAIAGQQLFNSLNCASCHSGPNLTDTQLHDVGTLTAASGKRIGSTLTGIETPTLIGLWQSAPYFHDGSAPNLQEVARRSGAAHGNMASLSTTQRDQLVEYLLQLDQPVQ